MGLIENSEFILQYYFMFHFLDYVQLKNIKEDKESLNLSRDTSDDTVIIILKFVGVCKILKIMLFIGFCYKNWDSQRDRWVNRQVA